MQNKRVLAKNIEQHLFNCIDLKLVFFYFIKYRIGQTLRSLLCLYLI
jgi:hypothetical protein